MYKLPMTVHVGAEFLDIHKPGWANLIDLAKFDIRSPNTCILGQLYGDYGTGMKHFGWNFSDVSRHWEDNAFGRL